MEQGLKEAEHDTMLRCQKADFLGNHHPILLREDGDYSLSGAVSETSVDSCVPEDPAALLAALAFSFSSFLRFFSISFLRFSKP